VSRLHTLAAVLVLSAASALALFRALAPAAAHPTVRADAAAGRGKALISYAHTLAVRDLATGREQPIVQLSNNDFVRSPRWLNGGQAVVYVDQRIYAGDPAADYGSDIWQANADGSSPHRLLTHDTKGADIDGVSVAEDGSFLVFGYTRTDFDTSGLPTGQTLQVLRLDLTALQTSLVADQAIDPGLSPDGQTVMYLNVAHADDDGFGLWASAIDGSGSHPVVTVAQGFLSFFTPRFSPDGRSVLFAAAPDTGGPFGRSGLVWQDGPPQDIWSIDLDGSSLTRLTRLAEDQPSAAWSSDGSQILIIAQGGLYQLAADGSALARLGDGYLHSELSWLDR
jgi:Tol biopolymer transport system component